GRLQPEPVRRDRREASAVARQCCRGVPEQHVDSELKVTVRDVAKCCGVVSRPALGACDRASPADASDVLCLPFVAGALEDRPQDDPDASPVTADEIYDEVRRDFEGGGGRIPGECKPTSVRTLLYRLGHRVLCELRQIETQLRFCFLRLHLTRRSRSGVTSKQADRSE